MVCTWFYLRYDLNNISITFFIALQSSYWCKFNKKALVKTIKGDKKVDMYLSIYLTLFFSHLSFYLSFYLFMAIYISIIYLSIHIYLFKIYKYSNILSVIRHIDLTSSSQNKVSFIMQKNILNLFPFE